MTDTNQLPPLPTLRPGDPHMESLIDAAILGHASTREAMRWLVRQIVPQPAQATQAEVTDASLIRELVDHIERNTCTHEETHRGGAIWEVCDSCGARWADDAGGKPEFKWPAVVEKARAILSPRPERVPMTERELELIDGMIAVQLDHAQRCDAISNRAMAEKQKGWDMERVELLRRIRSFGITAQAKKETP